jgi:periplasmic protein TonB
MATVLGAWLQSPAPRLPRSGLPAAAGQLVLSAAIHLAAAVLIVGAFRHIGPPPTTAVALRQSVPVEIEVTHLVFIARENRPGAGGGGGGNRQAGPIRRAEAVGRDRVTLRVVKPQLTGRTLTDAIPSVSTLPGVVLDARPLASGTKDVIGLPEGGVAFGTSTGPGSGGGVGDGIGTGIGSGTGPGLGEGSGGGTGGGVYRPGGSVTVPRIIRQVRPRYSDDALLHKVQGSVVLELVVARDGRPRNIHVIRSLDPAGLDERAIEAAREWEFEPGRLAGTPVDVLVTLIMDFRIQ